MSDKKITLESPARITLALDIIRKITDGPFSGYHELGIIKHKLNLADTISIEPSTQYGLTCNDPSIPTDKSNICFQATQLLKDTFHIQENIHITLKKRIPAQGGLAGGSSNAATIFMLLNQIWKLNLSQEKLIDLGRKIGADVSFFFIPGSTAFDTETTGILEPIKTNIQLYFILIFPPFGVSTKDAYEHINYSQIAQDQEKTHSLKESLLKNDTQNIHENIHNDFELSVFKKHPKLAEIKKEILHAGALSASMTGSGSTLYGIAKDLDHAKDIASIIPYKTQISSTYTPTSRAL